MKKILIASFCSLSLLAILFTVKEADASGCGTSCATVIHRPKIVEFVKTPEVVEVIKTPIVTDHVVNTIAVPVLVPAFQFQYQAPSFAIQPYVTQGLPPVAYAGQGYPAQGYGTPGVQGYAPQGYPQQGYPQQQGQGYGAPAQPYPQQDQVAPPQRQGNPQQDRIRELAKALLEEMNRQSDEAPPPVTAPEALKGPVGLPTGLPKGGDNLKMSAEQAASIAIPALMQNCAACHTGIGSKGEAVIFSSPGVFGSDSPWKSVGREIERGKMPPRDSQYRLTDQQRQAISVWLRSIN